ncbi:MAG: TolC family protein [Phycisphaeraceae bacterium]|nr:TolC family protein [Phycisphaeraceae bacterium]
MSKPRTRVRPGPAPLWLAASAMTAGCVGPLGPMAGDSGTPLPPERTRRLERLTLEQFRAAAPARQPADDRSGLTVPPTRLAADTAELSLEQTRADVLANNLDLKVALLDPSIASEGRRAEEAKFEAVFRPFIRYVNLDNPTFSTTTPNQQDQVAGGAGVSIPLRTGGRLSVDYTSDRVNAPNPFILFPTSYNAGLSFSLSHPLLRGAGRDATMASIRIAAYNEQIAEARTKLQVIALLANADRAYWALYAARRELEVRQQQFEVAREQLGKAERRVRAGDAPEIEITRAQSGAAERLETIIRAENAVLLAQRNLKRLVNRKDLDISAGTTLLPTSQPAPTAFEFDGAQLCALAAANRMELLEAEVQILAESANVDLARNNALPILNFDGSYSFNGLATTFSGAQESLGERRFQSFTAGLSAEVPIGNEAAEARLRAAILTRLRQLGTRDAREQTVRQEVLDAVDRVGAAWQRILAARQAAILAGRTLEGEQRQFDAGVRTSTDVLDAAARLADAQSAEIRALTDYEISIVDLSVATGTVLGAARVEWQPLGPALLQRQADEADAARREEAKRNPPALGPTGP